MSIGDTNMSIKKPYVEIIDFLELNRDKKVKSILDELKDMCQSKKSNSTVMLNNDNEVIAIYCYYHKQWELVKDVPYGKKANTNSGLNTMCKVGVSKWTKAQKVAKDQNQELLTKVSSGDILPSDILSHQHDIEVQRLTIDETDMPIGYSNEEELMQVLSEE